MTYKDSNAMNRDSVNNNSKITSHPVRSIASTYEAYKKETLIKEEEEHKNLYR